MTLTPYLPTLNQLFPAGEWNFGYPGSPPPPPASISALHARKTTPRTPIPRHILLTKTQAAAHIRYRYLPAPLALAARKSRRVLPSVSLRPARVQSHTFHNSPPAHSRYTLALLRWCARLDR